MKLGLSSFAFGWAAGVPGRLPNRPMDAFGLVDRTVEEGLTLAQLGDNMPWHTWPEERLGALADYAAQRGVQLELGARGLTGPHLEACAGVARRLGATLLRFVVDAADYHPAPGDVAALVRAAAPHLQGLVLGLENHDRWPARALRWVIEDIGDARVGVCLDTVNSLGAGEGLETVLDALGPVTVNWHVKDFQVRRLPHQMGFTVTGAPAGRGLVDVPGVLARLIEYGRCGSAVLEQWTEPEPGLAETLAKESAWASQSLAYLKPLFNSCAHRT